VEVFNDVSFSVAPITQKEASEMITEIKGVKILKGIRGKEPVDFKALIDLLMKTSRMLKQNPDIRELDINPVFALKEGAIAVDARIIID
jgi:acetyl-CoA synthetase (ADP-forming)